MQNQSLLCVCLGFGYTASRFATLMAGQAIDVAGTTRDDSKKHPPARLCVPEHIDNAVAAQDVQYVLVSVPPGAGQEWALAWVARQKWPALKWLGYLSSTGVYGDHSGAWVDETTPPEPFDERTHARLYAEQQWQALAADKGLPLHIFRLAGIYGPGRNVLEQLRAGTARRIVKKDHYFSRIHVHDIATILLASTQTPSPGAIYNVADDLPSPSHEPVDYGCALLDMAALPAQDIDCIGLSAMARSFYAANRRIANDKVKRELGINLAYPTYKEGLSAIFRADFAGNMKE